MVVKSACEAHNVDQALELDVGNTAIKWRRVNGAELLGAGRLTGSVDGVAKLLNTGDRVVRVGSVTFAEREDRLKELLVESGVSCQFAVSQRSCAGVINSYDDVSEMGVDRWLAMVAAFRACGCACVIVDAGTALTIDIIGHGGQHYGGYILPGAPLVLKVLTEGTGRVRFGDEGRPSTAPGSNTGLCVHNGKWLGLVGAVIAALKEAEKIVGNDYQVFITGGDGLTLKEMAGEIAEAWRYNENLVLDGLVPVLAKG